MGLSAHSPDTSRPESSSALSVHAPPPSATSMKENKRNHSDDDRYDRYSCIAVVDHEVEQLEPPASLSPVEGAGLAAVEVVDFGGRLRASGGMR